MTKRGRSTWGSKRKRGENSWELRYTVAGESRTETFHGSASEADRRLAELRIQYEGMIPSITLDQFWTRYYHPEALKRVELSSQPDASPSERMALSTLDGYERHYDHDIKPRFGDTPLDEIAPMEIQRWLDGMTNGKAKACKRILSVILGRAAALGLIDNNPAQRRFVYPAARSARVRTKAVFTLDELNRIYRECQDEVWAKIFILAAFGGGQLGETMAPMLDEIYELDNFAIVPVRRSVQRLDHEVRVLPNPKNEYRDRELVIPPPYSLGLMRLVDVAIKRGDRWLTDDGTGNPSDPTLMTAAYERWTRDRCMRHVPFGNLRNSYGTVLEALGMDGLMASKLMGHADVTTYYKHYLRPSVGDKMDALRKIMPDADAYGQTCP